LTKAWTRTSSGMSCARAPGANARSAAARMKLRSNRTQYCRVYIYSARSLPGGGTD